MACLVGWDQAPRFYPRGGPVLQTTPCEFRWLLRSEYTGGEAQTKTKGRGLVSAVPLVVESRSLAPRVTLLLVDSSRRVTRGASDLLSLPHELVPAGRE